MPPVKVHIILFVHCKLLMEMPIEEALIYKTLLLE